MNLPESDCWDIVEEIIKCPSEKRNELIIHIEKKDNDWLIDFSKKCFGENNFCVEKYSRKAKSVRMAAILACERNRHDRFQ